VQVAKKQFLGCLGYWNYTYLILIQIISNVASMEIGVLGFRVHVAKQEFPCLPRLLELYFE
jgi:hypothetical protein